MLINVKSENIDRGEQEEECSQQRLRTFSPNLTLSFYFGEK